MRQLDLGGQVLQASDLDVDAAGLERELRRTVRGEVRFDSGSRGAYATDASNYRQVPVGVVVPRDSDDVVAAVAACRAYGAPLLGRGGGTSLAGQCCNVAVVIDFSKYLREIVSLDPDRRLATVQPGVVNDDLRGAAERFGLTFGPDPATHDHCVLGGMIGNNACGAHAQMAGRTSENIEDLEILTYDGVRMRVGPTSPRELDAIVAAGGRRGEIYAALRDLRDRYGDEIRERYPKIPRRISGYAIEQLLDENGFNVARALVGSESTLALVLEATCRLLPSPSHRVLVVLGYPSVYEAADHVPEILPHAPLALEGLDDRLVTSMRRKGLNVEDLRLLPEGSGWLMVELGAGTREEADERADRLMDELGKGAHPPAMLRYDDPAQEALIWEVRESGLGATANVPGEPLTWEGWEDAAVDPERLGGYLRDFRKLLERNGYGCSLYGHFGQGCVHTRIDFDLQTAAGIRRWRAFLDEAADLVVAYGGSFSGEHGDGQARAELLPKLYGPRLVEAFRELKAIWDPDGRMNPGKLVDPYPITSNLRLGTDYRPASPSTHFSFPDDGFEFSRAALRCVGVGKCRREQGGVMCPSYMVTHEEEHSTRGRARLLDEMLRGDVVRDGWRSKEVHDALDLCLACKGCKSDCPVNVDMATYKAEFLSHHYAGRIRPRSAYSLGLIPWTARLASRVPALANLATAAPLLGSLVKRLGGVAPERSAPEFAPEPFTTWFSRATPDHQGQPVVLWPDTFTNYFHPDVGRAAVEVLQAAGFQVSLPGRPLCCGRPLYDYGMLKLAKRQLRQIVDALRPALEAGVPVVGLEPSCVAVFRDELPQLLHGDRDAARLSGQVLTLAELLDRDAPAFRPRLEGRALVQRHCHQHAVMGFEPDLRVLERLGLDVEVLDSGCCGMAGSFGFERGEHYEVAMRAGERVLLPRVREAGPDTLVLADGFSCRTQIEQGSQRRALHLAEVLRLALHQHDPDVGTGPPEQRSVALDTRELELQHSGNGHGNGWRALALISATGVGAAAGLASWRRRRR